MAKNVRMHKLPRTAPSVSPRAGSTGPMPFNGHVSGMLSSRPTGSMHGPAAKKLPGQSYPTR